LSSKITTLRSGYSRNRDNYDRLAADDARTSVKPCIDAERRTRIILPPSTSTTATEATVTCARGCAGPCVGACGHTYGCHDIWQMRQEGREPAILLPEAAAKGAAPARIGPGGHARALLESRPYLSRVPDQELIVSDVGEGTHYVQALSCRRGVEADHPVASHGIERAIEKL